MDFKELYKVTYHVALLSDLSSTIAFAPYHRAISAFESIKKVLNEHAVTDIYAYGTAAFRIADNAIQLIQEIESLFGIRVHVLSGHDEAKYIAEAVLSLIPPKSSIFIVDIGGASTEISLQIEGEMIIQHSFDFGAAKIYNQFFENDPPDISEIQKAKTFLSTEISKVLSAVEIPASLQFICSQGTLDVLFKIFGKSLEESISVRELRAIYSVLHNLSLNERLDYPDMMESRAKYVVAAQLILFELIGCIPCCDTISSSPYSLIEGLYLKEAQRLGF